MFPFNMKDKEFKHQIRDYFQRDCESSYYKLPFKPDYMLNYDNIHYFFEYENSSRGLVHNLTKIAQYYHSFDKHDSVIVYLIRTKHHQLKHQADYERACFLAKKLGNFYLDFRIINEQDFINETNELMLDVEGEDITAASVCGPCTYTSNLEYLLEQV